MPFYTNVSIHMGTDADMNNKQEIALYNMSCEALTISKTNESEDSERFKYEEYTIVGTVKSPLYIQYERGSTSLGSGLLEGFIYIEEEGFDVDYYTDIYLKLDSDLELFEADFGKFMIEMRI